MDELLSKAKETGEKAFRNGLSSTPIHDPALMTLLVDNPNECHEILKAWNDAWHQSNIKAGW